MQVHLRCPNQAELPYKFAFVRILCKHILFLILVVCGAENLIQQLRDRYIGEEDVKSILTKKVPDWFMATQTTPKMITSAEYKDILHQDPLNDCQQIWSLAEKKGRYATCTNKFCRKRLEVGTIAKAIHTRIHNHFIFVPITISAFVCVQSGQTYVFLPVSKTRTRKHTWWHLD